MAMKAALKVLLILVFLALNTAHAEDAQPRTIHFLKAQGIVNPVMSEFIASGLKRASSEGAEAVVIELDTPGGLDSSMREIVKAVLSTEVPVVAYVAPGGSRAASAGVFIAYAANIAAMAPGTNIGSAHPVQMGAQKMDEVMEKKVTNDAVAYIKGIAEKRKRNAEWAEKAVLLSVNITAEEALRIKVIDVVASDRDELKEKIHGMRVEVLTGVKTLDVKDARFKDVGMNIRHRVLNAISNPNVAYILMMIGMLGLYFELSNPGLILPGVVGAISLVLAFYSFQTLPINYAGLMLIGLAVVFFIVEIKVVSFGLLTIAGLISLVLGSLMLFDSPLPFMRLSYWVMLPVLLFVFTIIIWTVYYAVTVFRTRPVSGAEGLVGAEGVAADDISDDSAFGKVFVEGEYWNATSEGLIRKGERIRVKEVKGLRVKVSKA